MAWTTSYLVYCNGTPAKRGENHRASCALSCVTLSSFAFRKAWAIPSATSRVDPAQQTQHSSSQRSHEGSNRDAPLNACRSAMFSVATRLKNLTVTTWPLVETTAAFSSFNSTSGISALHSKGGQQASRHAQSTVLLLGLHGHVGVCRLNGVDGVQRKPARHTNQESALRSGHPFVAGRHSDRLTRRTTEQANRRTYGREGRGAASGGTTTGGSDFVENPAPRSFPASRRLPPALLTLRNSDSLLRRNISASSDWASQILQSFPAQQSAAHQAVH